MPDSYAAAPVSEIAHPKWPYWAPIRHEFDIRSFGVNGWRGGEGDEVIKEHREGPDGHEELYVVTEGRARFTIDGEDVDAPAGTTIFIRDPEVQRKAVAQAAGTTVLSFGGWAGKAYEVSEWERKSFA
jgi:hypothetical protein